MRLLFVTQACMDAGVFGYIVSSMPLLQTLSGTTDPIETAESFHGGLADELPEHASGDLPVGLLFAAGMMAMTVGASVFRNTPTYLYEAAAACMFFASWTDVSLSL